MEEGVVHHLQRECLLHLPDGVLRVQRQHGQHGEGRQDPPQAGEQEGHQAERLHPGVGGGDGLPQGLRPLPGGDHREALRIRSREL